ncbi:MAG: hypothetical protein J6I66_09670 [Lachnospiraceae bacterium]|nr:hypothetical protein [Lachnospiraceae bacterium]
MRKKYFALMMAGLLCSSFFMSGCGRAADTEEETVREDEEEDEAKDEDEGDEDEDDRTSDESEDEEVKPQSSAPVKSIDEDTLTSQTEVFLNGRDEWVISAEDALEYDNTFYAMTDLNYNGRAEIFVGYWIGRVNDTTVNVYEINETGDGFKKLDWCFTGCDSEKSSCPEVQMSAYVQAYYDKDAGISHYLFHDFYLYSFTDGGMRFCDLSIVGDTVFSDAYAMTFSQGSDGDEVDTFYGPNGEMGESEYTVYTSTYPRGYTLKDLNIGFYYGDDVYLQSGPAMQYMDDKDLGDILKNSYRVFAGRMDYGDFYDLYMVEETSMTPEELLEASIGSWGLVMTETEGDITYYSPGDDLYKTLDVYEDSSIHLVEEAGTPVAYEMDMNVLEHGDGSLMGTFMPAAKDGRFYDEIVISIMDVENGLLVVKMNAWAGQTYLGESMWYFEKLD